MNFEYKTEITLKVKVEIKGFKPSREAPACSNPSSPLYSDFGDDAVVEDYKISAIIPEDVFINDKWQSVEKEVQLSEEIETSIFDSDLFYQEIVQYGDDLWYEINNC